MTDSARLATARQFLFAGADAPPRFLLGRNAYSAALARAVRPDGFVDDYAGHAQTWQGLPVITSAELPPAAMVVNCSTSIWPLSADARLRALGHVQVLNCGDLLALAPHLPVPDFVQEMRSDMAAHADAWTELDARLADDASRCVLRQVMAFRLSGDCRHMAGHTVRFEDQYFPDFLPLGADEVFVDCGGFDGDTVLQFVRRQADYRRIVMFEPAPPNLARARVRLAGFRRLEIVPYGVSDAPGRLNFDSCAGSAASVSEQGDSAIDVVTIDQAVDGPVSFIKMDLEGWELPALRGARAHILADHPKLAISVYHHARDFREIPRYVLSLRDDYRIYLRHYTEGWSETVMYFLPV